MSRTASSFPQKATKGTKVSGLTGLRSVGQLTVGAQSRAQPQPGGSIHVQQSGGDTPDCHPAYNPRANQSEVVLAEAAVFAAVPRALPDRPASRGVHQVAADDS